MKDALLEFCGCLQMKKIIINRRQTRTQTSTKLHGSIRDRAPMARPSVTHNAITHATADKEKVNERDQFQTTKAEQSKKQRRRHEVFAIRTTH